MARLGPAILVIALLVGSGAAGASLRGTNYLAALPHHASVAIVDSDMWPLAVQTSAIGPDGGSQPIQVAQLATQIQAYQLGLSWPASLAPEHPSPSSAVLELVARLGASLSVEQERAVVELDELAEPLRSALTDLVDAYLGFHAAGIHAYADADRSALTSLSNNIAIGATSTHLPVLLDRLGVDLSPVFPARHALLEAVSNFERAAGAPPLTGPTNCQTLYVALVIGLDLAGCPSMWTGDVALLIDVGGDDTYLNNAGGSHLAGTAACIAALSGIGVGTLVDLAGNDDYVSGRCNGINGGAGYSGLGFLYDAAGNDRYLAAQRGVNGGGYVASVGFLLDAAGDDTYTTSVTIDGGGGMNGGGALGVGFLYDASGRDAYATGGQGANGGGSGGLGLLLEGSGDDVYSALSEGSNGGGYIGGIGYLVDVRGNDVYQATGYGANGGGYTGGSGNLYDLAGNDRYEGSVAGTNGGGSLGTGLLLDGGGTDVYQDGQGGTGTDRTVVPKGVAGAQIDTTLPPPPPLPGPPTVTDGPYHDVQPGCNGLDTICYKIGAEITYQGTPYNGIVEGEEDAQALPLTLPATYTGDATLGPDNDNDGHPATLTLETQVVTIEKDGSTTSQPGEPDTYPIDPDDNDPTNPGGQGQASATITPGCQADGICLSAQGNAAVLGEEPGHTETHTLDLAPTLDTIETETGWRPLTIDDQGATVYGPPSTYTLESTALTAGPETVTLGASTLDTSCPSGASATTPAVDVSGAVGFGVGSLTVDEPGTVTVVRCGLTSVVPSSVLVPLNELSVGVP